MGLYNSLLEKMEGRPYNGYFAACCPFHDDSKPSFFVYEESNNKNWEFSCKSCNKHGSLAYLAKQIGSHYRPERLTQSQSQVLPRWRKWEQKWGDVEGIARNAHKSLKAFPQFQSYFKKRKIYEYMEQGYFGYCDGWAVFPVRSWSGVVIDIVVRSIRRKGDTRYVVHPDHSIDTRPLYSPSWERVKQAETVYVVYGLIDSISLELIGLPVVTGITGKSLSPDLLKPLNKKFIIVPDQNEEREAYLLSNKLGWRSRVMILSYPDGTKDPDDIRMKYGNDALLEILSRGKDE